MFAHLDPCFRCHRCGTTQASLNHETAHLCACRNSGPIWTPYRRVRVDWGSIVAVAALVAALFAIRDEIRFWSDPQAKEAGADGPLGTPPKPVDWFCDLYAQIYGREALDQPACAIRFVKHRTKEQK